MMKYLFLIALVLQGALLWAQDVLFLSGGGTDPNLTIQSGVSVYVEGGYVAQSGAAGMELDGNLIIGTPAGFTANWTDNMATSSVLSTSTGTVYFESNIQQNITGPNTRFYNVVFNNSSPNTQGIRMLSNLVVLNQATFQDGLVYANSNALHINTTAPGAVTFLAPNNAQYSNSWLAALYPNGRLDREMTNSGSVFDFPVGSTSAAQLLQVTPTNITGISRFAASWENGVIGISPLSLSECGTPYLQVHNAGEWHLRPANGGSLGSGSFTGGNMTLRGWNLSTFPGLIDNQFALLWRAEGNNSASGWQVPNPACSSLAPAGSSGRTVAGNNVLRNGLQSFSDATSQLGIGTTVFVLPVELLKFDGYPEGSHNVLFWVTASELNADYYQVERSTNNKDFAAIGRVKAQGFSSDENHYDLLDTYPLPGPNYYRLKQVDNDGRYRYSNIILIDRSEDSHFAAQVYPNPSVDFLTLQLQVSEPQDYLVSVTDALGRQVRAYRMDAATGAQSLKMDLRDLPAAPYLLSVLSPNGELRFVTTVIKLY
ncbi:MAG: T9SS type A sorting domain-containing protein [Chitinophagales bacterium]|nr:T9SS type A sorting domain-containing protein [Chitinophagales bacterium]